MSLESLAGVMTLDRAEIGSVYQIVAVRDDHAERSERLTELGFLPGETASILARGQPGNEPLAVRVGLSTFALRKVEAACIVVNVMVVNVMAAGAEERA